MKEALKLALEALEFSSPHSFARVAYWKAIDAIKAALAQPAQRPWVGLTDEEIDYLYVEHRGDGGPTAICEQFAKAYETYLKEKNNG